MSSATPAAPHVVDRRRHPWLRRAWRWAFGTLFVAWSLLLIVWLTLQWGILPRVDQWRPQIEARASAALGVPVTIGAIRVRSGGWMPALDLDDVVLRDARSNEALRLPKVHAALSARSFLGLQLRFEQLLIDGATLEVRRDAAGRIFVGGLAIERDAATAGDDDNAAADWLWSQHEFAVRGARVRWIDEKRGPAEPLELTAVDLVIRNGLVSHELRLDATPPTDWGERFMLAGRFTQPIWAARSDWRRWSGSAYASLPRAHAEVLRGHGVELPFAVEGGEGALRAWVDWQGGQWRDATADVALAGVTLRFAGVAEPLRVARLEGRLRAQDDDTRLRLAAEGLRFASEGIDWPATQGEVVLRRAKPSGSAQAFVGGDLAIDRLDVGALAQLATRLPLGEPLRKLLAELAPSGRATTLSARWDGTPDDPKRYQAKGSVTGLTIAAGRAGADGSVGRPGWRNASFDFEASEAGGRARLVLDRGALVLPGIFEQPEIGFDSFGTKLAWKIDGPPLAPRSVEVALTETRFANADAQGELSVATWRTGAGSGFARGGRFPGQIDLAGQLSRGRAQAVARYLPLGVAEPARRYVERAVTGGNVASASFKVRGDLWDFPFAPAGSASAPPAKDGGGVFHIAGRVDDVTLAYVPSEPGWNSPWPAFTRVSGELVFDRLSMEIKNAQARVWGVEFSKVNGGMRDLSRPLLRLEGLARGPAADLLRYVNTTPVGEWTSRALAGASATGTADLKLALELPLDAPSRSKVQGTVMLAGNDVRLSTDTPLLAGAKARVSFTETGVQIAGGGARVLGGDATIEGGTQTDGALRFVAQGIATAEGLKRASELGALARLAQAASGQTSYRLALGYVRGQAELSLTSPLTGLALDLPAPLKKSAEAAWPLSVSTRLAADGSARDTLKVELGNVVQAQYERELGREAPQVLRGTIAINDTLPPLPARGVQALALVPALDLDAWQAWGERLQGSGTGSDNRGLDEGYLPRTLALRAPSATSGGRRLTQLVVGVSQDAGDGTWRGNLDADQLGGYVEYRAARGPNAPGRIYARLARLALPPSEASSVESLFADAPATVPALDIQVEDFELRGKKLGKLEIEAANRGAEGAARSAREWRLTRFALTTPEAQLTGSGQWQPSAAAPKMVMDFKLELADSGALLTRLGFPGTLRGGKGKLAGQLQWAGSPLALHVPSLDGKVNLALDAGQFLKAGPGAGRLLSVLSLQALPRRLLLDFRDVFQEGFAFDNIVGDVSIDDGVAHTNNLRMRGVQAAVLMEGSADINKETQQLRVIVVPEINAGTASLAYAAINPAVGLGTFLAQLLLRRPLIAASTREFAVQGSWAEPKVERVERKPGDPVPEIDVPAAASAPKAAS